MARLPRPVITRSRSTVNASRPRRVRGRRPRALQPPGPRHADLRGHTDEVYDALRTPARDSERPGESGERAAERPPARRCSHCSLRRFGMPNRSRSSAPVQAGVYTRISWNPGSRGPGVERQRLDCAALCVARGWEIAQYFEHNDASAYSGKPRPAYVRHRSLPPRGTTRAGLVYVAPAMPSSIAVAVTVELVGNFGPPRIDGGADASH